MGWFVGCLIKIQKGVKFDQDENQRTVASLGCPTHVSPFSKALPPRLWYSSLSQFCKKCKYNNGG